MTTIPTTSIYDTVSQARMWARTCELGEYLAVYNRDEDAEDRSSQCGYGAVLLDAVETTLRDRGMTLEADDRGLVAKQYRAQD